MNETLNAAQLKASREAMTNAMGDVIQQMQLRKWSMEQALGISRSPIELEVIGGGKPAQIKYADPIALAAEIYAFVAKPALELVAKADK